MVLRNILAKWNNYQQTADAYLREIQTSLENIRRMRIETDQLRAVSEPLLAQILIDVEQRIHLRQSEIAQLKVEKEYLQAKLESLRLSLSA